MALPRARHHVANSRVMRSSRDKTDKICDEKILNERTSQIKRNLSLFLSHGGSIVLRSKCTVLYSVRLSK